MGYYSIYINKWLVLTWLQKNVITDNHVYKTHCLLSGRTRRNKLSLIIYRVFMQISLINSVLKNTTYYLCNVFHLSFIEHCIKYLYSVSLFIFLLLKTVLTYHLLLNFIQSLFRFHFIEYCIQYLWLNTVLKNTTYYLSIFIQILSNWTLYSIFIQCIFIEIILLEILFNIYIMYLYSDSFIKHCIQYLFNVPFIQISFIENFM